LTKANDKKVKSQEKDTVKNEILVDSSLAMNDTAAVIEKSSPKIENIHHKVKSGETLNKIALQNNVSVDDLKQWNNLRSTVIKPGQQLVVNKKEVAETPEAVAVQTKPSAKKKASSEFIYYTIQRGDTLWTIAQKHKGCSVEEIKKLNNIHNEKSLKPGQKIKVAVVS
jgi:membrane-bound lytic murein transglycosylase D